MEHTTIPSSSEPTHAGKTPLPKYQQPLRAEPYRTFDLETVFTTPVPVPEKKVIWHTNIMGKNGLPDPEREDMVRIVSGGINIVASKDIRRNVRMSVGMGIDMAASGLRVLYVNSYAGIESLRECVTSSLERQEQRPAADSFRIVDCKMGAWDRCKYTVPSAVYTQRPVSYGSSETRIEQFADVVIINSFEYTTFSYRERREFASTVMEWLNAVPLTVVIFTHESKPKMSSGMPVRGPLGMLTMTSASLFCIDEMERGKAERGKMERVNVERANVETGANVEAGASGENEVAGDDSATSGDDGLGNNHTPALSLKRRGRRVRERASVHERIPDSAIKIFYSPSGQLVGVEYPKGYSGERYPLSFWPRHIVKDVPEGVEAVQLVATEADVRRMMEVS